MYFSLEPGPPSLEPSFALSDRCQPLVSRPPRRTCAHSSTSNTRSPSKKHLANVCDQVVLREGERHGHALQADRPSSTFNQNDSSNGVRRGCARSSWRCVCRPADRAADAYLRARARPDGRPVCLDPLRFSRAAREKMPRRRLVSLDTSKTRKQPPNHPASTARAICGRYTPSQLPPGTEDPQGGTFRQLHRDSLLSLLCRLQADLAQPRSVIAPTWVAAQHAGGRLGRTSCRVVRGDRAALSRGR